MANTLITTTIGKQHIASLLTTSPQNPMRNIAIGSGVPTTTALGQEFARKGVYSVGASGNIVTFVVKWDITDYISGTVREIGIFNSPNANAGNMLCAVRCDPIVKGLNDSLTLTINLTIV